MSAGFSKGFLKVITHWIPDEKRAQKHKMFGCETDLQQPHSVDWTVEIKHHHEDE